MYSNFGVKVLRIYVLCIVFPEMRCTSGTASAVVKNCSIWTGSVAEISMRPHPAIYNFSYCNTRWRAGDEESNESAKTEFTATTICLYSPGPVPAGQLSHRIGIYSNPLINGLIQHTFKINFVFVENSQ